MNKLIRWYNQNRAVVVIFILIIALAIAVIYTWNSILEQRVEENKISSENVETNTETSNVITSNTNTSIMTGEEVKSSVNKANTEVIAEFVEYCNEGEIEEAYNMLSEECKELLYPSLEYFKTNYYDKIFYMQRAYDLEAWYVEDEYGTYYITYTEDILSSGSTTSDDNRGDYITVKNDNGKYYINISSYVGREELNEAGTNSNVTITINYLDAYIDYTIANITVTNNTTETICLDTKEGTKTTYLYDENEVTYTSFLNEIADEQLTVTRGASINVNIKFNKIYNPERALQGFYFTDIVLNYEEYSTGVANKEKTYINIEI